ncbi:hypothetical protein L1987_08133 [Smallanthus sonchifolius]|uniref:Uncharacterized protein n=1 Tax=Smallanthus sonchifolius TaxID=185202 RepID=A0ACB9JLF6_9ASTR|nr:hypothetical protein L1987_08133 [Smallanthus sonchifolius]
MQETSGLYFFGGKGRTVDSFPQSYNLKLSREFWATPCDIFQVHLLMYNKDFCSFKSNETVFSHKLKNMALRVIAENQN